jgi:hypothetical protein
LTNILEVNNIIDEIDLTEMYAEFLPIGEFETFFSEAHEHSLR